MKQNKSSNDLKEVYKMFFFYSNEPFPQVQRVAILNLNVIKSYIFWEILFEKFKRTISMFPPCFFVRTRAIKSVKNVLSFGRRSSCEEKQSLFSRSQESSVESDLDTLDDSHAKTEMENISSQEIGLER